MNPLNATDWNHLNSLQLGKYAEYLTKMEFVLLGCDVFTSEVDDHGIDFVVRTRKGIHYDVQVKSFRGSSSYVFVTKSTFPLEPTRLLAVVQFLDGEPPTMFLIQAGNNGVPHKVFVDRRYEGKKSPPEWGLNISRKKLAELAEYCSFRVIATQLFELG